MSTRIASGDPVRVNPCPGFRGWKANPSRAIDQPMLLQNDLESSARTEWISNRQSNDDFSFVFAEGAECDQPTRQPRVRSAQIAHPQPNFSNSTEMSFSAAVGNFAPRLATEYVSVLVLFRGLRSPGWRSGRWSPAERQQSCKRRTALVGGLSSFFRVRHEHPRQFERFVAVFVAGKTSSD